MLNNILPILKVLPKKAIAGALAPIAYKAIKTSPKWGPLVADIATVVSKHQTQKGGKIQHITKMIASAEAQTWPGNIPIN